MSILKTMDGDLNSRCSKMSLITSSAELSAGEGFGPKTDRQTSSSEMRNQDSVRESPS